MTPEAKLAEKTTIEGENKVAAKTIIELYGDALFVAWIRVQYTLSSGRSSQESYWSTGKSVKLEIPDGATDLHIECQYRGVWGWYLLFQQQYPTARNKRYLIEGSIFNPGWRD